MVPLLSRVLQRYARTASMNANIEMPTLSGLNLARTRSRWADIEAAIQRNPYRTDGIR